MTLTKYSDTGRLSDCTVAKFKEAIPSALHLIPSTKSILS